MARTVLAISLFFAAQAAAQDRFEIQVYDSEVAAAGDPGLELHVNYVARGQTTGTQGEYATDHLLHLTLEPHLGLFGWGELGGYLQGALRPDGTFDYGGAKLRFKMKWPEKLLGGALGLAANFELSLVPAGYEQNRWGSEMRPILDVRIGPGTRRSIPSCRPISRDLCGPSPARARGEDRLLPARAALDRARVLRGARTHRLDLPRGLAEPRAVRNARLRGPLLRSERRRRPRVRVRRRVGGESDLRHPPLS